MLCSRERVEDKASKSCSRASPNAVTVVDKTTDESKKIMSFSNSMYPKGEFMIL